MPIMTYRQLPAAGTPSLKMAALIVRHDTSGGLREPSWPKGIMGLVARSILSIRKEMKYVCVKVHAYRCHVGVLFRQSKRPEVGCI